ncbi:hypothetical protein SSX86_010885 [Deinandra increscens subsp. villosa]|uniref:Hydroxyacylglutathione hydrolase C-terminal domain-containing protein n=1 Tax=Deinandra increscens subsp. villosa TaxID=3103831 RepID=A0AAP0H0Q2_9ASTR
MRNHCKYLDFSNCANLGLQNSPKWLIKTPITGIGYAHLSSGLASGLAGLSAEMAIRIVSNAGVSLLLFLASFFEGTIEQMYESLRVTLASLPKQTRVYCDHEYTVNNLQFAQTVKPENAKILQKLSWAQ